MSDSRTRIGWLAAAAIVALRVVVGGHFLSEGWTKMNDGRSFSAGFFSNAKGPLAPAYRGLVWDADGLFRLDKARTLSMWDDYRNRLVRHFRFDEKQQKDAERTLKTYEGRLNQFLNAKSETIDEYWQWIDRRDKNAGEPERELASLKTHDARIAGETRKLWSELIPPLDGLWKDLENDLNALATDEQWKRHGRLAIGKPGRRPLDSETMDRAVPWFDLIIGGCLVLGLFTRAAAILGAAFLASVCLSQWPLSPGAAPIFNQAVEMLALLVLAAVGAGRYLGLDYLLGGLKAFCCPPRKTGEVA